MKAEYLFEDYKLKLDYVKAQYERLWQRFSFFLTLETALFGFLGYLSLDAQKFDVGSPLPRFSLVSWGWESLFSGTSLERRIAGGGGLPRSCQPGPRPSLRTLEASSSAGAL